MKIIIPPTIWFENEAGQRWVPPGDFKPTDEPPAGFRYQCSQFPNVLTDRCWRLEGGLESGRRTAVSEGTATWPQDLVMMMIEATGEGDARKFALYDAILIAGNACKRCLNALYHRYTRGLAGFSEDSPEYAAARTRCLFCEDAPSAPARPEPATEPATDPATATGVAP